MWKSVLYASCLGVFVFGPTRAEGATLTAKVLDRDGKAASDAVISLVPMDGNGLPARAPEQAVIDQRHETFLPLVVVVRRGGHVAFTNNDVTKHQVYSFSQIKQFQFVVNQGETSTPVQFDKDGIAAIGCNIHDQMIAYVFVAGEPFAAVTDKDGTAKLADIPVGRFRVWLWHPQSHKLSARPGGQIDISGAAVSWTGRLSYSIGEVRRMSRMHMDY